MFEDRTYFGPTYSQDIIHNGGNPTLYVACRQKNAATIE